MHEGYSYSPTAAREKKAERKRKSVEKKQKPEKGLAKESNKKTAQEYVINQSVLVGFIELIHLFF